MELTLTKDNFEKEVLNSKDTVLIDFWATWCGPCKMMAPVIAELSVDLEGKVKVCKVNIDDEPEIAGAFEVNVIPTISLVKDRAVIGQAVGYMPKKELLETLGLM